MSGCGGSVGDVGPVEFGVMESLCDMRLKEVSEPVEPIVIEGEGCDSEAMMVAIGESGSIDSMVTFGEGFDSVEVIVR